MPRYHHLARGIEIDRHHPALGITADLITNPVDGGIFQAQHRGHCAFTHWHGFLHGPTPESHQAHCVVKGKGPRRDQCRKLAQAMACGDRGHCATPLTPQTVQGNAGGKNEGLCICRQRLIFGGTIFGQRPEVQGQRIGCLSECLPYHRAAKGRFTQHANALGALAGENKSYAAPRSKFRLPCGLMFSHCQAPSIPQRNRSSRAIKAADPVDALDSYQSSAPVSTTFLPR